MKLQGYLLFIGIIKDTNENGKKSFCALDTVEEEINDK